MWVLAVTMLTAPMAAAHLMRVGHGTINVVGEKAYVVLSLPVGAFGDSAAAAAVDDGILTNVELQANTATLREVIRAGVRVESGGVVASLPTIMLSLPTGPGHAADRGPALTVMIVAHLGGAPDAITFESTLWATDADALRIKASVSEGRETLRDEIGQLSPDQPAYTFFATPSQTFMTSVWRGLLHFWGGPDHLAFVLLLLAAAIRWRRRIGSMVAFVAACGIGMALAPTGWLGRSPAWVELIIATSVVLFAVRVLIAKRPPALLEHVVIVGLGVFHGAGFAAVGQLEGHLPVIKLAGFGLGIAIGVALLAMAWWAIGVASAGRVGDSGMRRAPRLLAGVCCALGLWWTVDRVRAVSAATPPLTGEPAVRHPHPTAPDPR